MKPTPTAERVREVLRYEPETGLFTWRKQRGKRTDLVGAVAGTTDGNGYVLIGVDYARYPAHRLAWLYVTGEWPTHEIDHVNRVRGDNRFSNLRQATHAENLRNQSRRRANKSGVIGVARDAQTGKWRANITLNGRTRCLGRYVDLRAAVAVRRLAEFATFGKFAGGVA